MANTPKLALPLLSGSQAQKHVTVNEALLGLDAMTQLTVLSATVAVPPSAPADNDAYIVGSSPSGLWAGHTNEVAVWTFGAWVFYTPQAGWTAFVQDAAVPYVYYGSAWISYATYLDTQIAVFRAEYASLSQFLAFKSNYDFWAEGQVVRAGDQLLVKRTDAEGNQVWVTTQPDAGRLQDMYVPARENAVKAEYLPTLAALSMLANTKSRKSPPSEVTILEVLEAIGYQVYGSTSSGGVDLPQNTDVPNAPTGIRSGWATSNAEPTTVTFAEAFASSTPAIVVTPVHATLPLFATVSNRTTTGFDVTIWDATSDPPTAVVAPFSYIAIANGTTV